MMNEERYVRQRLLQTEKGYINDILSNTSVLVCGAGGLGCPAALYLAAAGVGCIGIIDNDAVSLSNLNRQILYTPKDINIKKAPLAKERISAFNPDIKIEAYTDTITAETLDKLLPKYDLVMDCTDNYPTRLIIANAAHKHKTLSVVAGVREFEGFVLNVDKGACIGCLYGDKVSITEPPQVLGAAAGTLGSAAAVQAVLMLTGGSNENRNMLLLDLKSFDSQSIKLDRNPHCPVCGTK